MRHSNELTMQIVARCREGDATAFAQLVDMYHAQVFNFAYRICGNYDDAADIAQDAFLRVFRSIGLFRGDAHFTTWAYRIVKNIYLDKRKKNMAHNVQSLDTMVELEENTVARQVKDPCPGPEDILQTNERNAIVQSAIMQLPDHQRLIVVLYHVENKSYEEIAAIMELPVGTVKSRLNRARMALKDLLSQHRELFD